MEGKAEGVPELSGQSERVHIRTDELYVPVGSTVEQFDMARIMTPLLLVECPSACVATLVRFLSHMVESFTKIIILSADREMKN